MEALHAGRSNPFPAYAFHMHSFYIPDTFHMVLDMDMGILSFLVAGGLLGASHTDLPTGQILYPMVSTVWGLCEVKLKYLGSDMENCPLSLQ